MPKLRPYISLDLETTGLDVEKSQILQIGMVFDDGISDIEDLPKLNIIVNNPNITYSEPYAMAMNHHIFKKIFDHLQGKKTEVEVISNMREVHEDVWRFIWRSIAKLEKIDPNVNKIQFCGKNVAQFDLHLLKNNILIDKTKNTISQYGDDEETYKALIDHRTIDIGGVFEPIFGFNAGLGKINKLIGIEPITHDALQDAIDVVKARRWANENIGILNE